MNDERTNATRNTLIQSAPQHESVIRARDEVVNKWCADNGVEKDSISMSQLLEIRALPEWRNAT